MDADSSSKFIGSLTKFLQSLCNGYVEFQRGVELVGHIYLSIDTGEKVDYVLHEKVSKSDESSVTFVSNSFHALPPDKLDKNKSKDTSKQGNANINNAVIGAKGAGNSSDDDDLVIIESGSKDILGSTNSGTIPSRKRKASPSSDHHIQKVVKPLAGKSAVGQGVATNTRQQTGGPSATVSSQEGLNVGDMKLEQITSDELLSLASQVGEGHSRTSMPRSQGHRSGGSGDASGWIKQEALEDGDSDTGWSQGRDESNSNSGSNLYPVMLHQNTSAYSNPVFPGFSPHTGAPSSFANPVPGTSQDLGGIDASAELLESDFPCPQFSPNVERHLQESGDGTLPRNVWVWTVQQTASFYMQHFPAMGKGVYRLIGQRMYARYPGIRRPGVRPWSKFVKCVSQKVRHVRQSMKNSVRQFSVLPVDPEDGFDEGPCGDGDEET